MTSDDRRESLVNYAVEMVEGGEEYDISVYDLSTEVYEDVEARVDEVSNEFERVFEELNIPYTVCESCGQHRLHDEKQNSFYCPVCEA